MAGTIMGAVAAPLIGGVVSSMMGGGRASSGAQQAAGAADPFASQRPQYQQMLSQLMSGKTPFSETAGSRAATETGMDAMSAQMATRGLTNSGAEKAALTKYATGIAGQDYNQQMGQLMAMAGVGAGSTGTAGGILSSSADSSQNAMDVFGNTLGKAVTGTDMFKDFMGGGAPGSTDMTGFQTGTPAWAGGAAAPGLQTGMGSGSWASGGGDVSNLTDFGLKF